MKGIFENKIVFVTGSTRGIGLHIAKKFSLNGAKVFLNGRDQKFFKSAIEFIPDAQIIKGDLTNPATLKKVTDELKERVKNIDILVCNLGSGSSVKPGDENNDEWKRMFELNFFSAVNTIDHLKSQLIKRSGSILCISSICGNKVIDGAPLTYSCSKAALNAYVKCSANLFGEKGIRINAIAPGNILFEGSSWDKKIKQNKKLTDNILKNKVPLSRFGNPEEIADLACFLSSPKAAFVTGSIWDIDGGQSF